MPFAFVTLVVAAVGTLVALAGLSAVQARVHRRATWLSFLAPAAGLLVLLVGFLGMPLIEGFWHLGMSGLLLYVGGVALFGVVNYATAVYSRAAAVLLAVSGGLGCLSFIWLLASGGDDVAQWVNLAWVMVMALGWVLMGVDAIRLGRPTMVRGPSAA